VWVRDADATVAKVRAAGGSVGMEPGDVMDAGRMIERDTISLDDEDDDAGRSFLIGISGQGNPDGDSNLT
jgi:hypothetical protein